MLAHVYRSLKKADTYVFLPERDVFDRLPAPVRAQLEPLHHVMELDLQPGRRLARGDADEVIGQLQARGFYLQFPPASMIDPMTDDWGTDA